MTSSLADGADLEADLAPYLAGSVQRGGAVAEATRVLREAILDGVLPANTWLREETLSKVIGVSRTPVREALNRLEEEGLIERGSGFGARVTALTVEDMAIVYSIRERLESLAASRIAKSATYDDLIRFRELDAQMRVAADDDDAAAFNRLNVQFHHQLSMSSGNAYLSRLLATVEVAMRRFGAKSYTHERMHEILDEHAPILQAIAERDPERAARAAEEHASSALASTLDRLLGAS